MTYHLRIERDVIDVTMLDNTTWDPDWTAVDKAGHHHWRSGNRFPTLVNVIDAIWFADDGDGRQDEMVDSHFACSLCFEPIEPGRASGPRYIPALVSYYVDDVLVEKPEFDRILSEGRV